MRKKRKIEKTTVKKDRTFGYRIKKIRKALNIKQQDFATRLKISNSSLSEIEKGTYKPCHDFFVNISREFSVNLYYLFFGEGEMFQDPTALYILQSNEFDANNADVRQFLSDFQRSPILKYLILGHYRSIMQKEKDTIEKEIAEYELKQK